MSYISPLSYTPYKLISASGTNATVVKASTGIVGHFSAANTNALVRFVKFYDKATAPTVGTDTPVHTLIVPGNAAGSGNNLTFSGLGINFANGIAFAITGAMADTDTTTVAANDVALNIGYR